MVRIACEQEHATERVFVDKAVDFIGQHYGDDLTLERVAEIIPISPYYLSHLFRRQQGCTFLTHLTRIRVAEAQRFLEESVLTVTDIGLRVGYQDPNYFAQIFKRAVGLTPSEYRRQRKRRPLEMVAGKAS